VKKLISGMSHIGIAAHYVFGFFTELHLTKMITAYPFPHNLTIPCHFNYGII